MSRGTPEWAQSSHTSRASHDPRGEHTSSTYRYLLDLDDDLAQEFDLRMRVVARQITTVGVVEVPVGMQDTSRLACDPGGFGVLVVEGVLAIDTYLGDRVTSELVGAGDLMQRWEPGLDDLLERSCEWRALVPSRL